MPGLKTTTDLIRLITSSAATLDVATEWTDLENFASGTQRAVPGTTNTKISSATTTTIVAAPGASTTFRRLEECTVRNTHATLSCDVTATVEVSGPTVYELVKVTLSPGETLEYKDGVGWYEIGNLSKLDTKLRVSADVLNATTSFADITGLSVAVESGKHYGFDCVIFHIENASTTGARFGVNGPTMTAIRLNGYSVFAGSITAATFNAATADVAALDTSILGTTTSSAGTPQVVTAHMAGWFNPSAAGTFVARSQSEVAVAAGVTVKAGSWMRVWEFDN